MRRLPTLLLATVVAVAVASPAGLAAATPPTAGVVQEVSRTDRWDPRVDDGATRGGLSVSIVGDDGVRYHGSHYRTIGGDIEPGVRVRAGQTLGTLGRTGSARATPCHLHLGISPPCGTGDWQVRRGSSRRGRTSMPGGRARRVPRSAR